MMKVSELIEALKTMPQDKPVWLTVNLNSEDDAPATVVELSIDEKKVWVVA